MWRNSYTQYGSVAKFFHWVIFLLLVGMLIFGFFLDDIPKDYQGFAYNIHKLTGLTILCLMVLRALWALSNPKPILPADTKAWERVIEHVVHILLYLAVIAMPLVGWIASSADGRPPHLGSIQIKFPIEKNAALADGLFSVHNTLAIVLIVLISIHVLAALYHYFVKKDQILQRMMPQ